MEGFYMKISQLNTTAVNQPVQAPKENTAPKTTEEVLKSSQQFLENNRKQQTQRAYDVKINTASTKTDRTILEKTVAVNALQTADEGMKKTEDTLKKMQAIVEKAADSKLTAEDRTKLQKDFESLQKELDKTSEDTNYNGHKLLDGKFELETNTSSNTNLGRDVSIGSMSAEGLGLSKISLDSPEATAEAAKKLKSANELVAIERDVVKIETSILQEEVSDLNAIKKLATDKTKGFEQFTKLQSEDDYRDAFTKMKEDMLKQMFGSNTSLYSFDVSRIMTLLR